MMLTVKLRLMAVSDAKYGGFTTGSSHSILGVDRLAFRQLDSQLTRPFGAKHREETVPETQSVFCVGAAARRRGGEAH